MELEPPFRPPDPRPGAPATPSGPVVTVREPLRAVPSPQNLRASAHGLLVAGSIATALGGLFFALLVGLWFENGGLTARRIQFTLLLGTPVLGYGVVCLVRAVRMRRQAREAEATERA